MTAVSKDAADAIWVLEPPARPLRLGVIGAGWVSRACHLPSLALLRQHGWPVSVAAIADSSAKAIAATTTAAPDLLKDAQSFTSGSALLDAATGMHLDAVLLLTPPEVTSELLHASLALSLAVFAEKPVSEEVAELAALVNVHNSGVPVQVGYNRRWQPLAPAFHDSVSRLRATGSPSFHVEAHLWRAARSEPIFYRDTMIHAVDFLQWCLGPLEVRRVTAWPPAVPGGIASGMRAELRTTGAAAPVTVHLDVRPSAGRNRETYLAAGAKASIELSYSAADRDAEPARLSFWGDADAAGSGVREVPPCPVAGNLALWERGFLGQMAGFLSLAGIGSQTGNRCSLSEALAARQTTDAILSHESFTACTD